jgi:hypothetical protein
MNTNVFISLLGRKWRLVNPRCKGNNPGNSGHGFGIGNWLFFPKQKGVWLILGMMMWRIQGRLLFNRDLGYECSSVSLNGS